MPPGSAPIPSSGTPQFQGRAGGAQLAGAAGCPVAYYVNGFPVAGIAEVDSFAPVSALGGIEVYVDGSAAPMPYALNSCALVLVWTEEAVY